MDMQFYIFKMNGHETYKVGFTNGKKVKSLFKEFDQNVPYGGELFFYKKMLSAPELHDRIIKAFDSYKSFIFLKDDQDLIKLNAMIDYDSSKLRSLFWENIVDSGLTIKDLGKISQKIRLLTNKDAYGDFAKGDKIIEYLEKNYVGSIEFATNTEIHADLINDKIISINYSQRELGQVLKSRFKQKLKSFDGTKRRVYIMDSFL